MILVIDIRSHFGSNEEGAAPARGATAQEGGMAARAAATVRRGGVSAYACPSSCRSLTFTVASSLPRAEER